MGSVHDAYTHIQLPIADENAIRLLEIQPSHPQSNDGALSCSLRLASVNEVYVALSYMWGTDIPSKTILLNGVPFMIRQNLWDFLQQEKSKQKKDGPRSLWIDALCIQQTNIPEKNIQVARMGQVYIKASSVVIWLGNETEKSAHWQRLTSGLWDCFIESDSEMAPAFGQWMKSYGKDLDEFCKQDYWSRAWIVQECVLAAKLEVQAGPFRIPGSLLQVLVDPKYAQIIPKEAIIGGSAYEVLSARRRWREASKKQYHCPWARPVNKAGCFDIKDRIYSTTALMDPARRIVPDYKKTTQELFDEILDQNQLTSIDVLTLAYLLDLIPGEGYHNEEVWTPAIRERWLQAKSMEDKANTSEEKAGFLPLEQELLRLPHLKRIERNGQVITADDIVAMPQQFSGLKLVKLPPNLRSITYS